MQYTDEDFNSVKNEVLKKSLLFWGAALLLLAGCIVLVVLRMQALCIILTIAIGAPLIFLASVFLTPPTRYKKYLIDLSNGAEKSFEGVFERVAAEDSVRDWLPFRAFYVTNADGAERLLYWDMQKPLPALRQGARLRLTTYGQNIKGMEILCE